MLKIEASGMIYSSKIEKRRFPVVEKGNVKFVSGIIVHQTGAATAKSPFNSYSQYFANGAHFLIDKDGKIFQTASICRQTWHVCKLKASEVFRHPTVSRKNPTEASSAKW